MPKQSSTTIPKQVMVAGAGFVQALNNHYQHKLKRNVTDNIVYATAPAPGDTFTATVTLHDIKKTFKGGPVVGKQAAKEAAAKSALEALNVLVS